jgi:hypothetical protein
MTNYWEQRDEMGGRKGGVEGSFGSQNMRLLCDYNIFNIIYYY